jgi:outer membrane protein
MKSQRRSKVYPCAAILLTLLVARAIGQNPPASPERPWHSAGEDQVIHNAKLPQREFQIDPARIYPLAELVDLAEAHNPETRVAWESARAQAAAMGIARSELYPALSVAAISDTSRFEVPFGSRFYRETVPSFEAAVELTYTIFDFGARRGRIEQESARLLTANFHFNDVHRRLIFQVQQAYYQLLNAVGQEAAARASLANAQTVQQAAEERLQHGLATLPDVLEARSVTAQTEYDLQAILGVEETTRGALATSLGAPAASVIRVQPLNEIPTPESIAQTVEQAIARALVQRPDLLASVTGIREAEAERKQARGSIRVFSAAEPPLGAHRGSGR